MRRPANLKSYSGRPIQFNLRVRKCKAKVAQGLGSALLSVILVATPYEEISDPNHSCSHFS